jgi:hypothetical protein
MPKGRVACLPQDYTTSIHIARNLAVTAQLLMKADGNMFRGKQINIFSAVSLFTGLLD